MANPVRAAKATDERKNTVALREAQEADRVEPRADAVTFDPRQGLVLINLRGGWVFGFPPEQVDGLENATPTQIANIRLSPSADGIHWDDLDVDVSLTGLMARALHLQEWAPRIMGQIRSEAKARAARKNGLKGGRPRNPSSPGSRKTGATHG